MYYNIKYSLLNSVPTANPRVRQWPGPGESIKDSEGDGGGQQEVWQGQVEDEDVPGCPHLLPPQHGGHHQQVSKNWNVEIKTNQACLNYYPVLIGTAGFQAHFCQAQL